MQVRHFDNDPDNLSNASSHGWGFQVAAPAVALYNMRDYAQDSVARKQLELFAKYYGAGHAFFAWGDFFAALAFLAGLRRTLGCAASGAGLMLFFEFLL